MSNYFVATSRIQANPTPSFGQASVAQTFQYAQSTSTKFLETAVDVPTSGSTPLPAVPASWTAVDYVKLVNVGGSDGTTGAEVFVNLKGQSDVTTVGVSLAAPGTGANSGGMFEAAASATASQTNAINATSLAASTLACAAGAAVAQRVYVFMTGH